MGSSSQWNLQQSTQTLKMGKTTERYFRFLAKSQVLSFSTISNFEPQNPQWTFEIMIYLPSCPFLTFVLTVASSTDYYCSCDALSWIIDSVIVMLLWSCTLEWVTWQDINMSRVILYFGHARIGFVLSALTCLVVLFRLPPSLFLYIFMLHYFCYDLI